MRYLPFVALGVLCSGCLPNPDVLTMKEEPGSGSVRDTVYFTNGQLASQEISALEDGHRVNVWRYYEKGVLVREDIDTNHDGSIDTIKNFDPKTGALVKVIRDTNFDGTFDSVVEYDDNGKVKPLPAPVNIPSSSIPEPQGRAVASTTDERQDADYAAEAARTRSNAARGNRSRTPAPSPIDPVAAIAQDSDEDATPPSRATAPAATADRNRPASLNTVLSGDDSADTSAIESGMPSDRAAASRTATATPRVRNTPAAEDNVDGSVIQRITPPSRLNTVSPAATGRGVVPDATFQHPSAGLEE